MGDRPRKAKQHRQFVFEVFYVASPRNHIGTQAMIQWPVYFFAFLPGKTLTTRAKRDRRVQTCICLSRFFAFLGVFRDWGISKFAPTPYTFWRFSRFAKKFQVFPYIPFPVNNLISAETIQVLIVQFLQGTIHSCTFHVELFHPAMIHRSQ